MKRFFFCLVVLTLFGAAAALADEPTRALQARLKDGGYYFGELTGAYDSDTAAAVTRYQIRNGLPISGRLDAETAKSLGITAGVKNAASPAASDADTGRRLRKTDQQFLSGIDDKMKRPAAAKSRPSKPPTLTRSQPPDASASPDGAAAPDAPYASTFTLSRERLRDYIAGFVVAGLDPEIGAELEFFADRVRYYDSGVVAREKIRQDLQTYASHWPDRRFWLAGEIQVQPPQPDGLLRVTFPLRYELRNQGKRKAGTVRKTLQLQVRGEDLEIVGVSERKA
jgi:peptidoglycan hydrolase-like protein with peptidoglycan-binding domain